MYLHPSRRKEYLETAHALGHGSPELNSGQVGALSNDILEVRDRVGDVSRRGYDDVFRNR